MKEGCDLGKAIEGVIKESEQKAKRGSIIRFILGKISNAVAIIGSWFIGLLILMPERKRKR